MRNQKQNLFLQAQRAFSSPANVQTQSSSAEAEQQDAFCRASFELSHEGRDSVEEVRHRLSIAGIGRSSAHSSSNPLLSHAAAPGTASAASSRCSAEVERHSPGVAGASSSAEEAYNEWLTSFPSALGKMAEIKALLNGKRLAIFLDYDGTLTPIVANPDEAFLSQQMRDAVRNIALLFPTAIISGRGREKVEGFVQLQELYYAGSHGMDIVGPSAQGQGDSLNMDTSFQPAAHFRPVIDAIYEQLCSRLKDIPGSSVEHNTFCVSAHFRNCAADRWQEVVSVVEAAVADNDQLRITRGRKVLEVRPKVDWNKGTALEHLLGMLGLQGAPDVVTLYIGDDQTDEDAFRVLKEMQQGWGILVSKKPKDTAARYTVRHPSEVLTLLQALVAWGRTDSNGWVKHGSSSGTSAQSTPSHHTNHNHSHQQQQPLYPQQPHSQQQHSQQQQQQQPLYPQQQSQQQYSQQQHSQQSQQQQQHHYLHPPDNPQGTGHQPHPRQHPTPHSPDSQARPGTPMQTPLPPHSHQQPNGLGWNGSPSHGFGRQAAGPPSGATPSPSPPAKKPAAFWCGSASSKAQGQEGNGSSSKAGTAPQSNANSNGTH